MNVVDLGLMISFGDMTFDLKNVLEMQTETLGIGDDFDLFTATIIPAAAAEAIFLSIIRLLLSSTKGMSLQAIATSQAIAFGIFTANNGEVWTFA